MSAEQDELRQRVEAILEAAEEARRALELGNLMGVRQLILETSRACDFASQACGAVELEVLKRRSEHEQASLPK